MSTTQNLFEFHADSVASPIDALFFERLESFMEKSLSDIRAFAERECQPYEEARRYVAEWHAKNLFLPSSSPSCSESMQPSSPHARLSTIQSVLRDTSNILESLSTSSGVQSFLLAVDPFNPSDGGFLGGSLLGREFWRGFRGGGETGARSFKTHCTTQFRSKDERMDVASPQATVPPQLSVPPAPKIYHAKSLKNELYESVRSALRSTSGVRNAEMKWTNPERLDVYGVHLVGWPEGVPSQNPSSLKSGQNRLLLDALQNGTMRFERLSHEPSAVGQGEGKYAEETGNTNETVEDFSWAYDADASPSSPVQECSQNSARSTTTTFSTIPFAANETPSSSLDEHGESQQETWNLEDHIRVIGNDALYSTDYTWGDELHDSTDSVEVWGGADGESDRPRKRLRSEEPPDICEL